jgi:hypothetical protein
MPDTDESSTIKILPLPPPKGIAAWFVDKGNQLKQRKGAWKWVVGIVVGIAAFVIVVLVRLKLQKQREEILNLQQTLNIELRKIQLAKTLQNVETEEQKVKNLQLEIALSEVAVKETKEALEIAKAEHVKTTTSIDAISNWRDADRYLAGRYKS